MGNIALHGGNVNISGTGICVSCCHAPLVLCNTLTGAGAINRCGVNGEDNVEWRGQTTGQSYRAVFRTANIVYYATSAGVLRYTIGNVYIDTVYSAYSCWDVAVDSSGNMYIAHVRKNSRTLSKLNSSGTFQWAHDFGAPDVGTVAFCVALSYDQTRVAVSGNKNATVSLTVAGGVEWTRTIDATKPKAITFDAFGNVYVIRAGGTLFKLGPAAGGTIWSWTSGANSWQVVTDNVYVYVCGEFILNPNSGYLYAVTVAPDPGTPANPLAVWDNLTVGNCLCMDASGGLFVSRLLGSLYDVDPSNGITNWDMTGIEVWTAGSVATNGIHAGSLPVPLPWACAQNYIVGDLVTHNGAIYECTVAHLSCDLGGNPYEPGVGADWTDNWTLA